AEDVERRQDQERTPRVVVPANLLEVKGHAYLLKAVRNLKDRGLDLEVDIAGDGPLRQELLGEVEKLELRDRVSFLGLVPHEKLLDRMKLGSWDILVLPSIVTDSGEKEGIPVAIIEAMSCRVPVVSTQTGGIPELFEGVEDALLVPPRDPAALAEAIERLVTNPDLRERLIESGRRQVEDRFAVERVAAELARRFEMCRTHRREGIRSQ
ncbi:MAG: glycosyltransferase family 4 protein, partial [Chloroflexota bacterium]|nr:glycosyltransferase family 4 protein [Chloroflexota bacterium]